MQKPRKNIAIILPPTLHYSREITEGIVERHFDFHAWCLHEIPHVKTGQSPLPEDCSTLAGVIMWTEPRDQWVHDLIAQGIPIINVGLEWTKVKGIASVHFQHQDLRRAVISHFQELGIINFIALGHSLVHRPATKLVMEKYAALARKHGILAEVLEIGGNLSPSTDPKRLLDTNHEEDLEHVLLNCQKPVAFQCGSDHMGYIVAAVATRMGYRIPDDVLIMGQGDNLIARYASTPLSSVVGDAREVGRVAAECLSAWIESNQAPKKNIVIPGAKIIERESTVGKSGSVMMESIRRFLQTHAHRGVMLSELVQRSRLSEKTLIQRYRSAYGIHPVIEAQQIRTNKIKNMLENTDLSVAEIAHASGFSSQSAFTNYCQRHLGGTPSHCRSATSRR